MDVEQDAMTIPDLPQAEVGHAKTNPPSRNVVEKKSSEASNVPFQTTIRKPTWAYIALQHLRSPTSRSEDLDMVTAHLHLSASLTAFLGLHGSAIPIDILKLEGNDVWIRVPAQDRTAVIAAVGGWTGANGQAWRVKGWSSWSATALGRDAGQDLFND